MKLNNNIWILLILILLYLIFYMIHYLYKNDFIIECFSTNNVEKLNDSNTHSVDLPLTNIYSCQNFCGPTSKCAITGEQCFIDVDCKGCQPSSPFIKMKTPDAIPGYNSGGKLTVGVTPQYSILTSGDNREETVITNQLYGKPAYANFGINTWRKSFDKEQESYDKKYKPKNVKNMPNYPPMYSITGEFLGDGPLPANY
jgi:hypothetical protein